MPQPDMQHSWNVTPREAVAVQRELAPRIVTEGRVTAPRFVAGADISWDKPTEWGYAGIIVFSFPKMAEVERVAVDGPVTFPYVPGLLTFREGPLLDEAFARLEHRPDVVFFDGHGYAHPRRMGIASHMGLRLGIPSIGCGKSLLVGEHRPPGPKRGNRARIVHHGETIGVALRTRDNVNPIFVSVGHRVSLAEAIRLTLRVGDGYRVPKPTRLADHFVGQMRREAIGA